MRTIIIDRNWSRDWLDNPEPLGRTPDYLLIRLITVFDPAFCRVFFLALQANEGVVFLNVANDIKGLSPDVTPECGFAEFST